MKKINRIHFPAELLFIIERITPVKRFVLTTAGPNQSSEARLGTGRFLFFSTGNTQEAAAPSQHD